MDKEKGVLPTTNLKHPLDLYLTDTCGEDKNTYFLRTENQVWCKRISTSLLKAISLQLKKKKKSSNLPRDAKYTSESCKGAQGFVAGWVAKAGASLWLVPAG